MPAIPALARSALSAMALLGILNAHAAAITALTGWSGGQLNTSAGPQLWGWIFSLSQPIDVTALGIYDDYNNGFQDAHDVGIFRVSDQSLVTSATLPAGTGGSLENGFRYFSLPSPAALSIGDYEILMVMPYGGSIDSQVILASNVSTAAQITWLHSAFNDGSSLRYLQDIVGAYEQGMFGPNFKFVSAAVPEPTSLALTAAALAGVAVTRRRKATMPAS